MGAKNEDCKPEVVVLLLSLPTLFLTTFYFSPITIALRGWQHQPRYFIIDPHKKNPTQYDSSHVLEQQPLEDETMYATLPHLTNFLSFSLCISYRDKHVLLFVYQYMNFLIIIIILLTSDLSWGHGAWFILLSMCYYCSC